jgi:hypothetical protein
MPKTRALFAFIPLVLLSVLLAACGGSDGSTGATASGQAQTQSTTANGDSGEKQPDKQSGTKEGEDGAAGADKRVSPAGDKPASLATDPKSIPKAIVTDTGAVQTLQPSAEAQREAMRNSYASIKAFGEEAEGPEATDITFALLQYLSARAQGDWATACARLYSVLRENLASSASESNDPSVKGGDCAAIYGALMKRAPQSADAEEARIDVASVRRGGGNRAFVIYKTPLALSADMPMYLEDGVWTVGAIEAYVLTPQQLAENR